MRIKEITEAVMSVGVQSKYPVSPGARSLMGSRWRYDKVAEIDHKNQAKGAVDQLEHNLKHIPHIDYNHIDMLMKHICEKFRVLPKQLHDDFVEKFSCTPDEYAVKYKKSREGKPINV
jgi:ribosomal protein S18